MLGVTMIVGMIALASSTIGRLELRRSVAQCDSREAEMLAQSAIEYGLTWIGNDQGWRAVLTSGVSEGPEPLGNGTFTWTVTGDSGDLSTSSTMIIRGVGQVGDATAVAEATYDSNGEALSCLESALHCGGNIDMPSGSMFAWNRLYTNQEISSNASINNSGDYNELNGNGWAVGNISGVVTGISRELQNPARDMPDPVSVFSYYVTNGTPIDINSLPQVSGFRVIDRQVISPGHNPYGATNNEGIYVIDCQSQHVEIRQSRIVGTIVLLNNGGDSKLESVVFMEPAVPGYPSLMVQNNFTFDQDDSFLSEDGVTPNVNFNPPHTPYLDASDTDLLDDYPGTVGGLVYIGGQLTVNETFGHRTVGCVVVNNLVYVNTIGTFDYDSASFDNPPPGFRQTGSNLQIVPGGWRRTAL